MSAYCVYDLRLHMITSLIFITMFSNAMGGGSVIEKLFLCINWKDSEPYSGTMSQAANAYYSGQYTAACLQDMLGVRYSKVGGNMNEIAREDCQR
jgi:hypothetical protein